MRRHYCVHNQVLSSDLVSCCRKTPVNGKKIGERRKYRSQEEFGLKNYMSERI